MALATSPSASANRSPITLTAFLIAIVISVVSSSGVIEFLLIWYNNYLPAPVFRSRRYKSFRVIESSPKTEPQRIRKSGLPATCFRAVAEHIRLESGGPAIHTAAPPPRTVLEDGGGA